MDADTYIITAIKTGYKRVKQTETLEEGEEKEIEIDMTKTKKRLKTSDNSKNVIAKKSRIVNSQICMELYAHAKPIKDRHNK